MIILAIVGVFPNFHVWLQKARFVYKSATMPFGGPFSASPGTLRLTISRRVRGLSSSVTDSPLATGQGHANTFSQI